MTPETYLDTALDGYARAAIPHPGGVRELRLAGHTLRLRCATPALSAALGPPLAHLEPADDPGRPPDLEVSVMEAPGGPGSHAWRPWAGPAGAANVRLTAAVTASRRLHYELMDAGICLYDPSSRRGVVVVEPTPALPLHLRAAPLRLLLHWWGRDLGMQLLHAGAVSLEGRALLLVGPSGSGKSTLATACHAAGFDYLGDDYVLVTPGPPLAVHSLYRSAKLAFSGLELLDIAPAAIRNQGLGDEKAMLFHDDRLVRAATPHAVVLPRVVPGRPRPPRRLRPAEALRALAPSTLIQLTGSGQGDLTRLAGLTRRLPAYQLEVGADLAAAVDQLRGLLAGREEAGWALPSSA